MVQKYNDFRKHFWERSNFIYEIYDLLVSRAARIPCGFLSRHVRSSFPEQGVTCHNLIHSAEVRYFTHRQSAIRVTVPCTHYQTLDHRAVSPTLFDISRIVAGRTSYPSITLLATVEPFNSLVAYSRGHTPNCHPWVICLIRWYFSSSASPIQVVWSTLSLRRLNPRRQLLLILGWYPV